VLIRQQVSPVNTGVPTLGFDQNANGWMIGEGAGAVVLKRPAAAQQAENRVYATIDAIALVHSPVRDPQSFPNIPSAAAIAQSCQRSFQLANVSADDIGYLEVFASGMAAEDAAEIAGLTQAYRTGSQELTCGIGSIKANLGHAYVASGIASLIKTALCLYHRYVPAVPQWSAPKYPELWQDSPFYVATTSRYWSLQATAEKRRAAINSLGAIDGSCAHVILSEATTAAPRTNNYLQFLPVQLFPLAAENQAAMFDQLRMLEQALMDCQDLSQLASRCFMDYQQHPNPTYVIALAGSDKDTLIKEIQRAYKGITGAFAQGKDWQTPQGSYFTANPLGKKGGVAFVYPGAFTSYLDAGRHLYHLFPQVYDDLSGTMASQELKQLLYDCDNMLYPKSLTKLTPRQLEAYDMALGQDSVTLLTAGTIAAIVGSETLKTYFKLQPQAAFGYSLGEFSMMFALRVWENIATPAGNLSTSDLFRTRLAGPKNTIREFWGLPPSQTIDENLWATHVLLTPVERVREVLKSESKVYLTHVNTPQEVIIAGEKAACDRVLADLNCDSFPFALSGVLHCDPVRLEYNLLKQWMQVPLYRQPTMQLYSAADYAQTQRFDSDAVSDRIATALCQTCDFPRLIDQAYADGVRIFVELGPATTCARWIRETLSDREHIAISSDQRGIDNRVATVRMLARLLSHQAEIDLSPLYQVAPLKAQTKKSLIRTVKMGGPRFQEGILGANHQTPFARLCVSTPRPVTAAQPLVVAQSSSFTPISPMTLPDQTRSEPIPVAASSSLSTSMAQHQSEIAQLNIDFLQSRQTGLRQMADLIQQQIALASNLLNAEADPSKPSYPPSVTPASPYAPITSFYSPDWIHQPRQKPEGVLFDEIDLLEMACGKLSNVFGREYIAADQLPRCTRVPMPPYLFVSRVTKIEGATRGHFGECSIETEYDSPPDAWYTWGGCMPMAIAIEASHSNIFLMSYLGIDLAFQGKRVYRALGGTITCYSELPSVGQTIRCKVRNHSFIQMGEGLIFKFDHEVYVGDRLCLHMRCDAGFFSDEDLQKGQGILRTKLEEKARSLIQKQFFQPLLQCAKRSFSKEDIDILTTGNLAAVFGEAYDPKGKNPLMGTISAHMQLFDRIPVVDPQGGAWGVGLLRAEKTLEPDSWYFNCHFKDDFCMPGTMIGEGCAQLLGFYMLYLGLQTRTTNAKVRPIPGVTQTALYRGQILPSTETLTYQIEATEIGLEPRPYIKAEASVIYQGKTISIIKNMAVELYEDDDL
jgi:PfaB family protein